MSDDKLIKTISDILYPKLRKRHVKVGGAIDESNDTAKEIIQLVRESEWISVDDELPDNMDMGLTVYYKNDVAETDTNCDVYLDHLGFCVFRGKEANPIVGVTHWKRRPEPPKQE